MAEERTIDDILRELGHGDVADMAPVKVPSKEKTKAKVKDLIIEGAKAKQRGLNSNAKRLLDQIED